MEFFLILYIVLGSIGFLLMHFVRKIKERPPIISNRYVIGYYAFAALLLGMNVYKSKNEPELLEAPIKFDRPEYLEKQYNQDSYSVGTEPEESSPNIEIIVIQPE